MYESVASVLRNRTADCTRKLRETEKRLTFLVDVHFSSILPLRSYSTSFCQTLRVDYSLLTTESINSHCTRSLLRNLHAFRQSTIGRTNSLTSVYTFYSEIAKRKFADRFFNFFRSKSRYLKHSTALSLALLRFTMMSLVYLQ